MSRCCLCRRLLGLLELAYDTPAGPCCSDCDAELPERDRPSAGAVIEPIRGCVQRVVDQGCGGVEGHAAEDMRKGARRLCKADARTRDLRGDVVMSTQTATSYRVAGTQAPPAALIDRGTPYRWSQVRQHPRASARILRPAWPNFRSE